ncbi:sigma-54 dependent transcriptional regulator [bacterium]|nr:sigma-54 dependent transcriptional regulator [bacterium]
MSETTRVLVVDDDARSGVAVARFLERAFDCDVTVQESAQEALAEFARNPFPVVISDIRMPQLNGIELLKRLRDMEDKLTARIVLMTGYADLETALQAMKLGAFDYLRKPIDAVTLSDVYTRIQQSFKHEHSAKPASGIISADTGIDDATFSEGLHEVADYGVIGVFSQLSREAFKLALRYHEDSSAPVLIQGPTGTGKEAVARLIHHGKGRNRSPFIPVNCSAISPGLFESDLFGYEGGSFTGASSRGRAGKLELAREGTLFLDEISDLPIELQPKLLRVLQEREMYRVGGTKPISLNVRIIAATNRDMEPMLQSGQFRLDLYHRLALGLIRLPALSERPAEILPLAHLFLTQFAAEKRKRFRAIDPQAHKILRDSAWPGNIRELKNSIERVVILYDDELLRAEHLSWISGVRDSGAASSNTLKLGEIELPDDALPLGILENEIIRKAYQKFEGNQSKTAEYLGLARNTLRSRLKQLGLA